jgi:flagellar hook-associated protein 1 FlgK
MGMLGILNIGTTALLAAQSALNTTSNNIANVSTPGYTRQQVELSSIASGLNSATGSSGNGVTVSDITRLYDSFTTLQIRTEKSNSSYWSAYSGGSSSIENIFNETSSSGIASAISTFFNDWQAVAQNPQGSTERTQLISDANYLGSRIGSAYNSLNDQRTQLYKSSQDLVTQVNNITKQIADLNDKIAQSPGALDLKDQRDSLVESLNQIAAVNTIQDSSGRYAIFLGGAALVSSSGSNNMSVALDTNNNMQFSLNTAGTSTNINGQLGGGQLKANLDMRDTVIPGYMNKLNTFAIDLSDKVNSINKQGYGLDGSTGNNFFNSLAATNHTLNNGTGTLSSVNITDASSFNYDQYQIAYTAGAPEASADYVVTDLTTGATVVPQLLTIAPGGQSRTIEFNGMKMTIDGSMTSNETFTAQADSQAATKLAVSFTDVNKIAAAQTATDLPGGNTNAQAIAGLVNQNFVGSTDPVSFYSNIVSTAGADSQSASTYVTFENSMVNQLESQRQSTSGVNLDEEAVNMVQYQKSYEAAAKMISVASDLLDTVMGIIK